MEIFRLFGTVAINKAGAMADLNAVENRGRSVGSRLGSFFKTAGKAIGVAVAAGAAIAGAAIIKIGKDGVESMIEFEHKMAEVFSLVPDLAEDAKESIKDLARSLSVEFGRSADDVGTALYNAISAGVDPENLEPFMDVVGQMTVGGQLDSMSDAVLTLAASLNAYGAETSDAAAFSDVLFGIVDKGITTMPELSASLSKVTPLAAAAGLSFEDLGAWIAQVTSTGTPTAEAITYIRGALAELNKEGTKGFDAFKEAAGVTFPEFLQQGGHINDALNLLEQYAIDSGTTVNNLFGSIEAGGAVLAAVGPNADAFAEKVEYMGDVAGNTESKYETMNSTIAEQLAQLGQWWEDLKRSMGYKLEEPLQRLMEWLSTNRASIEDGLSAAFDKFVSALEWIASNSETVKTSLLVIGTGLGVLMAAINPIPTAIAAVTAAIVALISHWDQVVAFFSGLGSTIAETFTEIWESAIGWGEGIVQNIKSGLSNAWEGVRTFFSELLQGLYDLLPGWAKWVLEKVFGVGVETAAEYADGIESGEESAKTAGEVLATSAVTGLESQKETAQEAGTSLAEAAVEGARMSTAEMEEVGSNLAEGLSVGMLEKKPEVIGSFTEFGNDVIDTMDMTFGNMSPSKIFKRIGKNLMEGLKLGIEENKEGAISAATTAATEVVVGANNAISTGLKTMLDNVVNNGAPVIDEFASFLGGIVDTIWESGIDSAVNWFNGLVAKIPSPLLAFAAPILFGMTDPEKTHQFGQQLDDAARTALGIPETYQGITMTDGDGNKFKKDDEGNWVPFAKGGIFTSPTLLPAHKVAEAGVSEAYIPLSKGVLGQIGEGIVNAITPQSPVLAGAGGINIDMRGMYDGAQITVRNDSDIEALARANYDLMSSRLRAEGRRI